MSEKPTSQDKIKCFVLINTQLGKADEVVKRIRKLDKVTNIIRTSGAYEMIVEIEGDRKETTDMIIYEIKNVMYVKSTLTLMKYHGGE